MITDIYIAYDDDSHLDRIKDEDIRPFIHLYDERTKSGRREGRKFRLHWGASITPFVMCMEGDKPIKAFYSEYQTNVIEDLIEYLKNENIHS